MKREDSAIADAARGLLLRGDPGGAERVLQPVFRDLKSDSAVLHLMGMIKKAKGDLPQAERFVRAALASDLKEGGYYSELAGILQARGAFEEAARMYRAAIALMANPGGARTNLVRCLMSGGDLDGAEREARAHLVQAPSAETWTVLSQVQTARGDYAGAAASAQEAFKLAPGLRQVRHNLALALDRAGDVKAALGHMKALAEEGLESPEMAVNLARALGHEGQKEDAEAMLIEAVHIWPTSTSAHMALARMRWLRGEGEQSTAYLEEAMRANPDDMSLVLACADLLNRGEYFARAEAILNEALKRAPDHPALLSSMGVVLDESGRVKEALQFLSRAAQLTPGVVQTHRNLVPTLLRAGDAPEALRLASIILKHNPDDQELIAYHATAMRAMGDANYRQIFDYDRLVKVYDIPAPRGYFSIANFNAILAETLHGLHKGNPQSMEQTFKNGSQTPRSLLLSQDVNIKSFFQAMEAPVRSYVDGLIAHPQDPLGRRKGRDMVFNAAWSVRLTSGGYHHNHVHQTGWISSIYFVAVPDLKKETNDKAGWAKFGEPRYDTPGCGPERYYEPKAGRLILFPSYMWHGSVPFTQNDERLTISFDVAPA